jgi:hypothetical protein
MTMSAPAPDTEDIEDLDPEAPEHEKVRITVHNEDDGDVYHLRARATATLERVIDRLYERKLRRERRDDDRLGCEAGGEEVFQFEHLSFETYLAEGHCPGLVWLFVAGTGGADDRWS